ncbi:uncharacterized protein LOC141622873 [Silene latifolia]|uniref:uncharacterized protein LOC141622873 n=1 Tax=Silene latifolia TaxID=37657 RepID=UPI003D7861A1
MAKVTPARVFEDYEPPADLVTEDECDTFLIYLPGFKKEELRVQLSTSGMLKVSGERPLSDHIYQRFYEEFRLASKCDTKKITAKFEGGILFIRQPKLITPEEPQEVPPPQQLQQEVPEKAKDDEEKCGGIEQPRKVVNYGLFREPNNIKKLGVSVAMVFISAFFISYMFKSSIGSENESMMGRT